MNDETFEFLKRVIQHLDNASGGFRLSDAGARNLSYSLKHMIVNELRTDAKYELAKKFEDDYGIR